MGSYFLARFSSVHSGKRPVNLQIAIGFVFSARFGSFGETTSRYRLPLGSFFLRDSVRSGKRPVVTDCHWVRFFCATRFVRGTASSALNRIGFVFSAQFGSFGESTVVADCHWIRFFRKKTDSVLIRSGFPGGCRSCQGASRRRSGSPSHTYYRSWWAPRSVILNGQTGDRLVLDTPGDVDDHALAKLNLLVI